MFLKFLVVVVNNVFEVLDKRPLLGLYNVIM